MALLSSGQSSTITGTLAGQIVMEGFLHLRVRPWLRRLMSRGLAIIPAVLFIVSRGERAIDELLVLSQVVLSLQLSFAVVPLVSFTSDRRRMGDFANRAWVSVAAWLVAAAIAVLNINLVVQQLGPWLAPRLARTPLVGVPILALCAGLGVLLAYLVLAPAIERFAPGLVRPRPERVSAHLPRVPARARGAALLAPLPDGRPRRIALALELGAADPAVIDHVRALPLPANTQIVLMHVVESAAGRYLGPETADAEAREDKATLESLADELRARGRVASVMLGFGNVQQELARMATEVEADLIITGAHGHRLLADLVFGSTTSGLRHRVRIPVLTVRGPARPR